MNQAIIVGLVVGGGVAVIGAYVGHLLRLREIRIQADEDRKRMKAIWAEEERRRKSDRRRDLYQRELGVVSGAVDAASKLMATLGSLTPLYDATERVEPVKQVALMIPKARVAILSLEDEKLRLRYEAFVKSWAEWSLLWDWHSGKLQEEKRDRVQHLTYEVDVRASEVRHRIREILEEV